MKLLRDLTIEERVTYVRDGVVCLRGILSPEVVETTRSAIEAQRRAPTANATIVDKPDLFFLNDFLTSMKNDGLRTVAMTVGGAIAKQLLAGMQVRWVHDSVFYKGARQVAETPWHQDTPYGNVDGPNAVRVWIPVDPVPRATTLEVVRGSHLWNVEFGVAEKFAALDENTESLTEGEFSYLERREDDRPPLPDIEAHRDSFDIIGHEVNPGDVVAFNYHILHHAGAGVNLNARRRAFTIVYSDERTPIKRRPNPVPGPLEAHGITDYQDGQTIAEFPDVFQRV